MSKFKYGEKVAVSMNGWKERRIRYFIMEAGGCFLTTIDCSVIKDFHRDSSCSSWWDRCSKLSEKKYRPFTMEEFKEHKDKWLVSIATSNEYRVIFFRGDELVIHTKTGLCYLELICLKDQYTFEDGSPCGVEVVE